VTCWLINFLPFVRISIQQTIVIMPFAAVWLASNGSRIFNADKFGQRDVKRLLLLLLYVVLSELLSVYLCTCT